MNIALKGFNEGKADIFVEWAGEVDPSVFRALFNALDGVAAQVGAMPAVYQFDLPEGGD